MLENRRWESRTTNDEQKRKSAGWLLSRATRSRCNLWMRIKGLARCIENKKIYTGVRTLLVSYRLLLRVARELFFILTTRRCFIRPRVSPLSATAYRHKLRNHASPLISPWRGNTEAIMRLNEMQYCCSSRFSTSCHLVSDSLKSVSAKLVEVWKCVERTNRQNNRFQVLQIQTRCNFFPMKIIRVFTVSSLYLCIGTFLLRETLDGVSESPWKADDPRRGSRGRGREGGFCDIKNNVGIRATPFDPVQRPEDIDFSGRYRRD